jgi:hypothetical protein
LALGLLAAFGDAVAGVIVGMIVLDLGATGADISNRTIIFSLRPEIRTCSASLPGPARWHGSRDWPGRSAAGPQFVH